MLSIMSKINVVVVVLLLLLMLLLLLLFWFWFGLFKTMSHCPSKKKLLNETVNKKKTAFPIDSSMNGNVFKVNPEKKPEK